jgi:hypothetical protein
MTTTENEGLIADPNRLSPTTATSYRSFIAVSVCRGNHRKGGEPEFAALS